MIQEINKSLGKIRIHYGLIEDNKHAEYPELNVCFSNDCEQCPCGWEDRDYDGECNAWGCYLAKKSHE